MQVQVGCTVMSMSTKANQLNLNQRHFCQNGQEAAAKLSKLVKRNGPPQVVAYDAVVASKSFGTTAVIAAVTTTFPWI